VHAPSPPPPRRGLTLTEFVLGGSALAALAAILAPRVLDRLALSRDARRLADVVAIREALEGYRAERGDYPPARRSASAGGWDISHDGAFLTELVRAGYLDEERHDPLDDDEFHYRYYRYDGGEFGCSDGPFYVLGVRGFETPGFGARNVGSFRCGDRDWSDGLAYVTGGGGGSRP
jgi:hypothetical protein